MPADEESSFHGPNSLSDGMRYLAYVKSTETTFVGITAAAAAAAAADRKIQRTQACDRTIQM
jgi:hypothetical protein